jgi:hypothetical protein
MRAAIAPMRAATALARAAIPLAWAATALIGAVIALARAMTAPTRASIALARAVTVLVGAGIAPMRGETALTRATVALARANAAQATGITRQGSGKAQGRTGAAARRSRAARSRIVCDAAEGDPTSARSSIFTLLSSATAISLSTAKGKERKPTRGTGKDWRLSLYAPVMYRDASTDERVQLEDWLR